MKLKTKLRFKRLLWKIKNMFHKYTEEEKKIIKENKKLIKEFPFLLPKNRYTGLVSHDYDYMYTELDDMPKGWRDAFGIEMCQKIKTCLEKANYVKKYSITQIKEKFGTLRWYDNGAPQAIFTELENIINYYEDKSMLVCINCGKPTKYRTIGWIEYICKDCLKKSLVEKPHLNYVELTWSHIPQRIYHNKGKIRKGDSPLKGEMMVTWKRYSKHNCVLDSKNTIKIAEIGLW